MIAVEEALHLVLEGLQPLGCERVMLRQARGRVLGQEVVALRDVPPFRNSAMDGYAVRSADVQGADSAPVRLRVQETIAAGSMPTLLLEAGSATRIMTGSPLPRGADTVVRIEDTTEEQGAVRIRVAVPIGANVREAGEDMRAGEKVLHPGRELRPADVGLLASLGIATLLAHRRPRVAIVSTGDELVDVGEEIGPGQIVNSNAYTLAAAVEEAGGDPVVTGVARDTPAALQAVFRDALSADVVLSTGGVSMGSFDFVRQAQRDVGAQEKFWKVAQKPGKPLSYALCSGKPFFGLPGNPVSSLVCFYVYVFPLLRRLLGASRSFLPTVEGIALEEIRATEKLTEFVRCEITPADGGIGLRPTGSQSSGVLRSMSAGEALVIAPPGVSGYAAGSRVRAIHLAPASAVETPPF